MILSGIKLNIIITVAAAAVSGILAFIAGTVYRKKIAEAKIGGAEQKAKSIVEQAVKEAETKKKEALLEAKDEIHKSRNEFEKESKERRKEMNRQESRIQQKEEALDKKSEALEKKDELLNQKIKEAEALKAETDKIKSAQLEMLEKISGLSVEDAKEYLLKNIETEVRHEAAIMKLRQKMKPRKEQKTSSV